jgi:PAS domain S-box-containing protein
MRKGFSSNLRTGLRFSFWPTALIGIVVIKAVLSLEVKPGSFVLSYSGISYFLLLFLAASFAIRNGIQNTLERRPFWVYLAIAYGLWALHQCITLYYELGRHIDAPDSSIADPALFLHIVPLMAAVATLRHQNVSDRNPYRAILNSLLLLFFWSFLYGYLVFPYQYFPNATSYALRFDILYLLENLALVLFVGILILREQAPWKSIYLHLWGASTLYALSSAIANLAIDSRGYVNGKLYGLGLTASVCWFVWIPLCARQVKGEATAMRPDTSRGPRRSVWAMLVVVMVSIPIIWELFQRNEDTGLRTLRLLVAIVAILCLASAAYVREYLAGRELDFQNEANAALREREERQAYLLKLSDALRPLSDPIEIQETASRLLGEQLQTDRAFSSEIDEARGLKVVEALLKDGRKVGALRVADMEPGGLKSAEIELVRETAERTWAAVERARAEASLSASEGKYRTLFDSIDVAITVLEVLYDDSGVATNLRFIETNRLFEEHTGLKNHLGKTASELIPNLEDHWAKTYARVAETGEPVRFENYAVGLGRWFNVFASRVGGEGSRLVNVVFNDITERKEAENALRQSEERKAFLLKLSDALRPLSDPIEIEGTAGRMLGEQLRADRTLYATIDAALGEIVIARDFVRGGAPSVVGRYRLEDFAWIRRISRPTFVDDARTAPFIPDPARGKIIGAGVGAFIAVPLVKDSQLVVAAVCVCVLEPRAWTADEVRLVQETAERTWAAVVRAKAETALRESEERFRLFLENVHEYALVQLDPELRITSWNPGAERIFGYTSKEALGQPFALLLSPEDRADHVPRTQISILEKTGRNEDARWLIHKDGTRIWTRWVTEPIRNKDGQITGLAKVLRDETERLRTETSLRQSENLAVVGRMASSIAHEINNPLEAVTNLIYLARSRDVSPEVGEFLEQAEHELARVSQVTLATLHFHRQTTEPQIVDIEEILESVLVLHKGRLKSNQIATERRYSLHSSIICQENEIRQVLANLISNSIDAMKNMDARRLTVRVRRAFNPKTGEEGVRVMIADTGLGIRESAAKHVFEPFFTTKAATGTGLGLWISAEAVKKHQGTLRFRSRSAGAFRGTVFSLYLGSGEQLRKAWNSHPSAVDLSMG